MISLRSKIVLDDEFYIFAKFHENLTTFERVMVLWNQILDQILAVSVFENFYLENYKR